MPHLHIQAAYSRLVSHPVLSSGDVFCRFPNCQSGRNPDDQPARGIFIEWISFFGGKKYKLLSIGNTSWSGGLDGQRFQGTNRLSAGQTMAALRGGRGYIFIYILLHLKLLDVIYMRLTESSGIIIF